jgi:hypothetical protein
LATESFDWSISVDRGDHWAPGGPLVTGDTTRIPILQLGPEELRGTPQIGRPATVTWDTLCLALTRSIEVDPSTFPGATADERLKAAKASHGGWAAGTFTDNHRAKAALVRTCLMLLDIDHGGHCLTVARALSKYRRIVASTFRSTPVEPRCFVVLQGRDFCTNFRTYDAAHGVVRAQLAQVNITVDDAAKDVSRLRYKRLHQPGVTPEFLCSDGELIDFDALAALLPKPPLRPRPTSAPTGDKSSDRYAQGALRSAYRMMAMASEGERHKVLFRAAAGLARPELGLSDAEIMDTMLPPAVRSGVASQDECERVLRDAIRAGRSGAQ